MFSAISSPEKNKVTHAFFIIKWLSDIKKHLAMEVNNLVQNNTNE